VEEQRSAQQEERRGCAAGEALCAGVCLDVTTDPENCGACGKLCADSEACLAGVCGCATGETMCDDWCTDTATDVDHCGACGNVCEDDETCVAGKCSSSSSPSPDCGAEGDPCCDGGVCDRGLTCNTDDEVCE